MDFVDGDQGNPSTNTQLLLIKYEGRNAVSVHKKCGYAQILLDRQPKGGIVESPTVR